MDKTAQDTAGVVAPPPLIYGVPLAAGLVLQHFYPEAVVPASWARIVGPLVTLLGLVGLPAAIAFRRLGTAVQPWRPATSLVLTGPYRFTRNPMYLGLTLFYIGISLWVNSLWPLLLLPVVLIVMTRGVIVREEAYLARRFGDTYQTYRATVRRWL